MADQGILYQVGLMDLTAGLGFAFAIVMLICFLSVCAVGIAFCHNADIPVKTFEDLCISFLVFSFVFIIVHIGVFLRFQAAKGKITKPDKPEVEMTELPKTPAPMLPNPPPVPYSNTYYTSNQSSVPQQQPMTNSFMNSSNMNTSHANYGLWI